METGSKKIIKVGLIILIIILILIISFKVFLIFQLQKNWPIVENSSTAPQTSSIPADWKIYRNKEYGFEVSYPKDWMILEEGNFFGFNTEDSGVGYGIGLKAPGISIGLNPNEELKDYWIMNLIDKKEQLITMKFSEKEILYIGNKRIIKAFEEKNNNWFYIFDSPEISGFTDFLVSGRKRTEISDIDYQTIAEQMISTFRFLKF